MSGLHEECGVFGIFATGKTDVTGPMFYGLHALQHRGQEGCGMVVADDGVFRDYKDLGLLNEVFVPSVMAKLGQGNMGVGHVRYGTSVTNNRANCQPIVVRHSKGSLAMAYNGNVVNTEELREELEAKGAIFHTSSDTEVMSCIVAMERLTSASIEEAVCKAMYRIKGAYSTIVMSPTKLIALRDENGIRPLCYGQTPTGEYIVASETCALDAVGAKFIRDIEPGEIVVFSKDGIKSIREHCGKRPSSLCVFEYIYFARPDSVVDGCSVHEARVRAGAFLALKDNVEADVVIGVPDSGIDAAIGYARQSGIPYAIGLIKNKYIGRTFIAPEQKTRQDKVKLKLNAVSHVVNGKRVVLVDDSIVRGTTSAVLVKLLRDAGATEVHMRVSAPPFIGCCYYGTDIDNEECLIANRCSMEEMAQVVGVDSLGFLDLEDVGKLANTDKECNYCMGCFTKQYPAEIPADRNKIKYENKYEKKLSEKENN